MNVMDSLSDILNNKDFDVPPEIGRIKDFVRRQYDSDISARVSGNQIIITADSAALASTLRINLPKLSTAADTDKKLVIRIG